MAQRILGSRVRSTVSNPASTVNPVPRDLLCETDNLAQTQAGLFPGGDPMPNVDIHSS